MIIFVKLFFCKAFGHKKAAALEISRNISDTYHCTPNASPASHNFHAYFQQKHHLDPLADWLVLLTRRLLIFVDQNFFAGELLGENNSKPIFFRKASVRLIVDSRVLGCHVYKFFWPIVNQSFWIHTFFPEILFKASYSSLQILSAFILSTYVLDVVFIVSCSTLDWRLDTNRNHLVFLRRKQNFKWKDQLTNRCFLLYWEIVHDAQSSLLHHVEDARVACESLFFWKLFKSCRKCDFFSQNTYFSYVIGRTICFSKKMFPYSKNWTLNEGQNIWNFVEKINVQNELKISQLLGNNLFCSLRSKIYTNESDSFFGIFSI